MKACSLIILLLVLGAYGVSEAEGLIRGDRIVLGDELRIFTDNPRIKITDLGEHAKSLNEAAEEKHLQDMGRILDIKAVSVYYRTSKMGQPGELLGREYVLTFTEKGCLGMHIRVDRDRKGISDLGSFESEVLGAFFIFNESKLPADQFAREIIASIN